MTHGLLGCESLFRKVEENLGEKVQKVLDVARHLVAFSKRGAGASRREALELVEDGRVVGNSLAQFKQVF